MAIPVNIEDLLHKRKIESTRIEFKTGWNPDKIYRTICAFANDFDNIGGGYIVVGVQEEENTGIAKRPVTGVPIEELDKIQHDMIGFNHKIEPFYLPRIDVQEVDEKYVLLIWVPAGVNRPYKMCVNESRQIISRHVSGMFVVEPIPLRRKVKLWMNCVRWRIVLHLTKGVMRI